MRRLRLTLLAMIMVATVVVSAGGVSSAGQQFCLHKPNGKSVCINFNPFPP
jgi:hypothetical protein